MNTTNTRQRVRAGAAAAAAAALLAACDLLPAPEPTPTPMPTPTPSPTPAPLGFPGSPVTRNADWEPVIQEFDGVPMALVPVGCFTMGSDHGLAGDEWPDHEQCFDEPFWIDVTEVTNAQYGSEGAFSGDNMPRETVGWGQAAAFCESRGGRLPTEREWEYAARGPDGLDYPWGSQLEPDYVVYHDNAGGQPAEVGSRPEGASWVGALDMAGNVFEWTSSLYAPYPYDPDDGREDPSSGGQRVLRGGSWFNQPRRTTVRSDYRVRDPASRSDGAVGFRCVRDYGIDE
jgi:formylglycine-generating enzyme required for sulfatase activity